MPEHRSDVRLTARHAGPAGNGSALFLAACWWWPCLPRFAIIGGAAPAPTADNVASSSGQEATVAVRDPRPSSRDAGGALGRWSCTGGRRPAPSAAGNPATPADPTDGGHGEHPADHPRGPRPRVPPPLTARKCWRAWSTSMLIIEECRRQGITVTAGRGGCRNRADGEAVQHSRGPVAEDAQAGAERHAGPVCQRYHLAHAGLAKTGRRAAHRSAARSWSKSSRRNTARRSASG